MRLRELSAQGVYGLADTCWTFAEPIGDAGQEVVFIVGGAGAGKTRFLDAIFALYEVTAGPRPEVASSTWRSRAPRAYIEAVWMLSAEEEQRAGLDGVRRQPVLWEIGRVNEPLRSVELARLVSDVAVAGARLEYWPATRQWPEAGGRQTRTGTGPLAARLRHTKRNHKYAGLAEALQDRTWEGSTLAPYRDAIANGLEGTRLHGVVSIAGEATFVFARSDGEQLALDELSDAEQQAALFALWSPWLGLAEGIVLVDSPELFIHPARLPCFFDRLLGLWPAAQVFVATNAEELAASPAATQVIRLD